MAKNDVVKRLKWLSKSLIGQQKNKLCCLMLNEKNEWVLHSVITLTAEDRGFVPDNDDGDVGDQNPTAQLLRYLG